jgi:hypothetical protein
MSWRLKKVIQHCPQFNPIPRGRNEKEEDIDGCIFDGFLRTEDKVYVTLTGGCPFEDSFEVTDEDIYTYLQLGLFSTLSAVFVIY